MACLLIYRELSNRLFSEFIQTKKRYPTSLDKICILTRKLLDYQAKNFLVYLTPIELAPCKIFHICRCAFNDIVNSIVNVTH